MTTDINVRRDCRAGESDRDARVRSAVLASAIGSVAHPFVADVDNDDLRASLVRITGPLAGLPDQPQK